MKKIKLGYAVETGETVYVEPSHIIATGVTQRSGKTTTLEALMIRSLLKSNVFKTKVGETGFTQGTVIPPFFRERSDWQYVASLLEATLKEKLKFERAWIIKVCRNAESLVEVRHNIDVQLAEARLSQLSRNVYTTLAAYLDLVLPQLQYASFSKTLTLHNGINIMDLEAFREEIQSLVIRSVLDKVLNEFKETIIVMPEAWKFLPQGRGNPCKRTAEAFIRQGATNENFLWIDSQDMAGVDKLPLKQVTTWILGLQTERNEVKHTLDQIPLPRSRKPKEEEIMTLQLGHFILASPDETVKVYVQPAWLDDKTAKKVALGEIDVDAIKRPLSSLVLPTGTPLTPALATMKAQQYYARVSKDLVVLRTDFFNKLSQVSKDFNSRMEGLGKTIMEVKATKPKINTEEVVSLVLQKLPMSTAINKDEIVAEVLQRIPKMAGTVTYEVPPLEKLTKTFLEEAKNQILSEASQLDDEQKKMLKWIESIQRLTNISEVLEKCLFVSSTSGGTRQRVGQKLSSLAASEFLKKDQRSRYSPNLKQKITSLLEVHNASPEEIEAVYNHIIMEMLK